MLEKLLLKYTPKQGKLWRLKAYKKYKYERIMNAIPKPVGGVGGFIVEKLLMC